MLEKLIEIFGKENVLTEDTVQYSQDKWPRLMMEKKESKLVKAVVFPGNTEQICKLLEFANQENLALIPFGGGSGVCGALVPQRTAVMINLQRMAEILEVNEKDLMVTAEAGIRGDVLEAELQKLGYSLGHFPASIEISTLGGWLATRSSGQMSTKYGEVENMVLSMEVVLANGQVLTGPIGPTAFPGPQILPVFVGSEGILGIITKATLRIMKRPSFHIFQAYRFKTVEKSLEATREILRAGLKPSVIRIYDSLDALLTGPGSKFSSGREKKGASFILAHPRLLNKIGPRLKKILLVLVVEGEDEDILTIESNLCQKICQNYEAKDVGEKPALSWYAERYKLNDRMMEKYIQEKGAFLDTVDIAAPWSKLPKIYYAVRKALSPLALVFAHWSHFYPQGGCAYFTFIGKGKTKKESLELYQKCWDLALEKTMENGGIISHHHGIGLAKLPYFLKQNESELLVLKSFKKVLDPNNILNPGKLGT